MKIKIGIVVLQNAKLNPTLKKQPIKKKMRKFQMNGHKVATQSSLRAQFAKRIFIYRQSKY